MPWMLLSEKPRVGEKPEALPEPPHRPTTAATKAINIMFFTTGPPIGASCVTLKLLLVKLTVNRLNASRLPEYNV